MVTNSEVVVLVQKVGRGQWIAFDQNGTDHAGDIPVHALRKVADSDQVLHRITTTTGKTQWRAKDFEDFRYLFEAAVELDDSMNLSNEKHEDIVEFIANSPQMIPNSLVISDTKWKYLVRSILRGRNILMTGPSGCGKTLVAQTLSNIFNDRPYFYFNLGSTQDARSTLIGNTHFSKDEGTFVSQALFVKAISTPNAIILLDEFSRAHHDAVNILMTVLDQNQKYLRIDEAPDTPTVPVAEGVTFIATANIGAEYTATRVLDRAILDRFQIIEMDTLNMEQELGLLNLKYPEVDDHFIRSVAEIADHTRKNVRSDDPKVSTIVSTRQTVEMTSMAYDGFTLEETAEVCVYPFYSDAGGVDSERTYMKQLIQKYVTTNADGENPWSTADDVEDLTQSAVNV
jgi:nitric oxide reductase NorQ protein